MKIRNFLSIIAFCGILGSCTDDFNEMNENPTAPTEIPVEYVFTNIARQGLIDQEYVNTRGNLVFGATYAHYLRIGFAPRSFHASQGYSDATWDQNFGFYSRNINDVIARTAVGGDSEDAIKNATARIVKAVIVQRSTDLYGDIPYSEAGQGSNNSQPKYDTQEAVYKGLLDDLKACVETIGSATDVVWGPADPVFEGDVQKWKKFANSMRLRMAVRSYDKMPEFAKAHIEDALASGVMESNDESAALNNYAGNVSDTRNPWHESNRANGPFQAERSLVSFLQDTDDPRLFVWFSKAAPDSEQREHIVNDTYENLPEDVKGNYTEETYPALDPDVLYPAEGKYAYRGRPMGYDYAQTGFNVVTYRHEAKKGNYIWFNYVYSGLGETVIREDGKSFFLTYAEVCFLKSEIAARSLANGVTGSAAEWYQKGIEANMAQWAAEEGNLPGDKLPAEGTLAANMTSYTAPAFSLENLYLQRWASYMGANAYEAYAFVRRVGQDALKAYIPNRQESAGIVFEEMADGTVFPGVTGEKWPYAKGETDGLIPGRLKYGTPERSLNSVNYEEAASRIGGDEIATKVWWAK
jgi:hypothetical protein